MNEDHYYNLIAPFIPLKYRQICSRRDRRFLGAKNKNMLTMNAYAYIHQGSPCYRFCICRYFRPQDILNIYIHHTQHCT